MGEKKRLESLWLKFPTTFRQDVGTAHVGGQEFKCKKSGVFPVKKGDLIIKNPSRIQYGLQEGSGDLIGWTEKRICDIWKDEGPGSFSCSKESCDGCGFDKTIAIFTSIEDKSDTDRISVDQLIWFLNVRRAGGISKVFREGVELSMEEILSLPRRPDKKNRTPILERMLKR